MLPQGFGSRVEPSDAASAAKTINAKAYNAGHGHGAPSFRECARSHFLATQRAQESVLSAVRATARTAFRAKRDSCLCTTPSDRVHFHRMCNDGRKSGEFQPAEHVTACHRLSPLRHRSLWGRKVRKRLAKPAPLRWVCKSWLILPVVICLSQSLKRSRQSPRLHPRQHPCPRQHPRQRPRQHPRQRPRQHPRLHPRLHPRQHPRQHPRLR